MTLVARGAERLARVAGGIPGAQPVVADVSDARAMADAVAGAVDARGPVGTLVLAAGVAAPGRFEELPETAFREAMEVNYFGLLNTLRPILPTMREAGRGEVLIVASAAALLGLFGYGAYGPSKFAARGLAETLRAEYRPHGVRVAVVHPPDVETPMLEAERPRRPPETAAIAAAARTMDPDAVARIALRGLRAGRADIYPGLATWGLGRFVSLVKPALDRRFDRVAASARRGAKQ